MLFVIIEKCVDCVVFIILGKFSLHIFFLQIAK